MANTATAEQLGIKLPANAKSGQWIQGYHYLNGTFASEKGVLHPDAGTPGAGEKVSAEVNAASAKLQGVSVPQFNAYLATPNKFQQGGNTSGQTANGTPQFSNVDQVTSYLNNQQQQSFSLSVPSFDEMKTSLTPTTAAPEVLNRAETRQTLRAEAGVGELETSFNDLRAQQRAIEDQKAARIAAEREGAVPMGVIEGRISEVERQENERLTTISREISSVTDQLTTKYSVINTYMTDIGLDYQDAVDRYDKEFAQNMSIYNALLSTRSQAVDEAKFNYQIQQDQINAAKSNLQLYVNAVSKGNLDFNSLSDDQKVTINKLELQSGLPLGFISSLKMDPGANILFTSSNDGVTQVGFRNADGTVSVQNYGTKNPSKLNQKETEIALSSNAVAAFNAKKGADGYVDPKDYKTFKQYWVSQGGDAKTFDSNFAPLYVNPSSPQSYGVSEELVNPDAFK